MNVIKVRAARVNNLKDIDIDIPLGRLVAVVGKSGSGKSSLVYDVLFAAAQSMKVKAEVSGLPSGVYVLDQRVEADSGSSSGETVQRRLAKSLTDSRTGDLLILDEPSAGMAAADRRVMIRRLQKAVSKGASIIMVEHSPDMMLAADHIIEIGPGAGARGGKVVYTGSLVGWRKSGTVTARYALDGLVKEELAGLRTRVGQAGRQTLAFHGITKYNLKKFDLEFPLNSLVCLTGRTGSGKSTLLSVVYRALFKGKNAWKFREKCYRSIKGKQNVRRSYLVDQSPLSGISTSTPATYLGVWDNIRAVYAGLPISRSRKLTAGYFSFNKSLSRAKSDAVKQVKYKGVSIRQLENKTVNQAVRLFADQPLVVRKFGFLQDVGLGYLRLGQRSGSLSGGEAQRVRLARVLSKKLGDRCIYILDNPARGLHLSDLAVLVRILRGVVEKGNTVLIAENREEIRAGCDHLIRL